MERHKQSHTVSTQKIRYKIIHQSRIIPRRKSLEWIQVLWGELVKYHRSIKMLKHGDAQRSQEREREEERWVERAKRLLLLSFFLFWFEVSLQAVFFLYYSLFVLYFKGLTSNNIKRMMSSHCMSKPNKGRKQGRKIATVRPRFHLLKKDICMMLFHLKQKQFQQSTVAGNSFNFLFLKAKWILPMGKLQISVINLQTICSMFSHYPLKCEYRKRIQIIQIWMVFSYPCVAMRQNSKVYCIYSLIIHRPECMKIASPFH